MNSNLVSPELFNIIMGSEVDKIEFAKRNPYENNAVNTIVGIFNDGSEPIEVNMYEFMHKCKVDAVREGWYLYSCADGTIEMIDMNGNTDGGVNGYESDTEFEAVIKAMGEVIRSDSCRYGDC